VTSSYPHRGPPSPRRQELHNAGPSRYSWPHASRSGATSCTGLAPSAEQGRPEVPRSRCKLVKARPCLGRTSVLLSAHSGTVGGQSKMPVRRQRALAGLGATAPRLKQSLPARLPIRAKRGSLVEPARAATKRNRAVCPTQGTSAGASEYCARRSRSRSSRLLALLDPRAPSLRQQAIESRCALLAAQPAGDSAVRLIVGRQPRQPGMLAARRGLQRRHR
jgi:hypothetical protein